ncbi:DUF4876 domain-containing protein [Marinifilum flexuosum]|uniref:DUF4876 domain-containing protein n=1 Tax=Marinifilum flexuosum TaxID=1117708 RepID=UPI00248F5404|nr:DUF4876 domain-containing protein [Marinifilum flexuosum]
MKIKSLFFVLLALAVLTACDDDNTINKTLLSVNVNMPDDIKEKNPQITEAEFNLTNVNTGEVITKKVDYFPVSYFEVEDGLYNVDVNATIQYESANQEGEVIASNSVKARAVKDNVEVKDGNLDLPLNFFIQSTSNSFVISEIFFSGTSTLEGKSYRYDKFFEIYNNTNETLYADGMCIGEGAFNTVITYSQLSPEAAKISKAVLHAIYRIPGSGKEYPIGPGKTLVLADIAKDHTEDNENSFDLSNSNFEWFDDYKNLDVDVPEVANLEKVVSYSRSIWTPHSRGYNAYVIFKLPNSITAETFATENAFDYSYVVHTSTKDITMNRQAWAIDTDDVIDAVECSAPSKFKGLAYSPKLDVGYTFVGETADKKYGHSVKRRVEKTTEDGRIVLMDNNDSSIDFLAGAANPSPGVVGDAE